MSSKRKPDPPDQMPLACDRKTLDAALRQDFVTFIQKTFNTVSPGDAYLHAPYIEAIAWRLRQCLEGKTKRLVITMPPRSLKSICASVALPAWALGRDPTSRIICASYSSNLTRKHANDCRTVLESDWYKRAFPGTRLHPNKNTEMEFMTTERGFRLGTSVGGTLTGRGGNIIIIDDPMKPDEAMSEAKREAVKQWYNGTLYSRLDNKAEDVIILVMQRLHMDDLVGYKRAFPGTRLHPNKNTEMEFMTTERGFRLGTSVGGTLTGRGGNIIIIDDPMKPDEAMSEAKREAVKQWYNGTLYSRLDNKAEDVIILVMQRLHMDDLVGHVLEKENWVHLNMPAIAEADQVFEVGPGRFYERKEGEVLHPEREPKKVLDDIKETLGSYHFAAQYQQNPLPAGGNMVKWEWFQIYGELPTREANDRIVQSWDTASKAAELNDYSVCTTWLVKGNDYYLIDVVRERLEYPNLKKRVLKEYAKHMPFPLLILFKDPFLRAERRRGPPPRTRTQESSR